MTIQFYQFGNNSAYEKQWTWAWRIHATSHVINFHCDKCGRSAKYPSGSFDMDLEGGSAYPDVLGCGSYPLLVVSERVISAWSNAGVQSFQMYPVTIASITSDVGQLSTSSAPKYYGVEVTGNCMIDLAASGVVIERVCEKCGEATRKPMTGHGFKMVKGSWDGSDLFRDSRYFPRVLFCTEKVLNVASARSLTNFRFEPMEEPSDAFSPGIAYLQE